MGRYRLVIMVFVKLHTLQALIAAIDEGSLRAAARRLRVSQPALTKMVRELELELGATLLQRSTKGVLPTPQGKVLVEHARPDVNFDMTALTGYTPDEYSRDELGFARKNGVSFDDLLLRSGTTRKPLETALAALLSSGDLLQLVREPRIFLSRSSFTTLCDLLKKELAAWMAANPLKQGIGKEELKTRLPRRSDQRFFTPLLAALEKEGAMRSDRELVIPVGTAAQSQTAANMAGPIAGFIADGGIEPPTLREITEKFRCDEKTARDHLALLVRQGVIVRISGDLHYSAGALDGLREKLVSFLKERGEITPPEYRELTGLSRKFLIPLLEHFDSEKVTIRVGDKRLLRKK